MQKINSELQVRASKELEDEVKEELAKAKANELQPVDIKYLVESAKRSDRRTSSGSD